MLKIVQISNGNRTEWSPIRCVIIRVINRIRQPHNGRNPICLITSMITDQIGRHKVLLPINLNFNKICDTQGSFFKIKTQDIPRYFLLAVKKSHFSTRVMARTAQLLTHVLYHPITLSN